MEPDPYNPGFYDAVNNVAILGRVTHDDNSTGIVVNIESVTNHPQYDSYTQRNDIAIIKFAVDIEEDPSNYIQYLYLQPTKISIGTVVWANGWGKTTTQPYSKHQMKVQVPLVEKSQCESHGLFYDPEMICAGLGNQKDTCEGDSGSSLVYKNSAVTDRWVGVGLTSFGGSVCGGVGVLGTYTNVTHYIPWIKEFIPDWTQPGELPPTPSVDPTTISPTFTDFPSSTQEPTSEPEEPTYSSTSILQGALNLVLRMVQHVMFGYGR